MKIYKLSYRDEGYEHKGYDYVSSKRKADRLAAKAHRHDYETEISVITINPTKKGILKALNQYAGHPDNG